MKSAKTHIIQSLFDRRWDKAAASLRTPVVTLEDVSKATQDYNATEAPPRLSTRNPANFFKDFIRKRSAANRNWPAGILARGYTARQKTGEGACFEFVRLAPGQKEPFPASISQPAPEAPRHKIESASLPLASRRLGRKDEPWLVQVLVRLRVIETHLSIASKRKILQVDHLQMSVKLRRTEIDALFLAIEQVNAEKTQELIICCEAKGRSDDILVDQIVGQVKAVFDMPEVKQNLVLPIAVKATGPSEVYVVEFEAVRREEAGALAAVSVANTALYELVPAVPGIGK